MAAVTARSWPERERNLCAAYEAVAGLHNDLGLTAPLDTSVRPYFDRPFLVIDAGRVAAALRDTITADDIRFLPPTGAIDQFIDSTDALGDQRLLRTAISTTLGHLSTSTSGGAPSRCAPSRCALSHESLRGDGSRQSNRRAAS
jgi:hypothetical protein